MQVKSQVIEALRKFLPDLDSRSYPLFKPACQRAIWAFKNCRTHTLGWKRHHCEHCDRSHFSYHSCNHKSCPQCGKYDTAQWVRRQMQKKICTSYYMLTFTLPAQLRAAFQGKAEKWMYDLFFQAASQALAMVLKNPKWLGAEYNGFMMVLHTWNQQLQLHPHIHTILPAAGLDKNGRYVELSSNAGKDYLLPVNVLIKAYRGNFHRLYLQLRKDHPSLPMVHGRVWSRKWGIDIKPVGDGSRAIKYLARYVNRTAISDSRILSIDENHKTVTFKWIDRAHGDIETIETIAGVEFVKRFLLHVLPKGLRSIRYYGFCHPASKKRFQKVAFHSGCKLYANNEESQPPVQANTTTPWTCPCCSQPMQLIETVYAPYLRASNLARIPVNHKQEPEP